MAPKARQTPEQRRERALAQWAERWAPGTKPTKAEQDRDMELKLMANFWGHADSLPRCYTCRRSQARIPAENQLNHVFDENGNMTSNLLPCGCDYMLSMLEMYMVCKGLFNPETLTEYGHEPKKIPKTIGKHRASLLLLFESLFGRFTIEKLLNIGNSRVTACQSQAREESRGNSQLRSCAPYDIDD